MKERIEFQPKTHLIQSLINTDLPYSEGIAELIDNAIDKKATRVDVTFDGRNMVVVDNGEGCSDLGLMLSYGGSMDSTGVAIGRYGVGLKNTACALAKRLRIKSVSGGFKRTVELDWANTETTGWAAEMDVEQSSDPNGTTLELIELYKRVPPLAALAEEIEKMFWPAIKSGVSIVLDGDKLSEIAWPDLVEAHTCSSSLGGGVSFQAVGGIVAPGQTNKGAGPFVISYRHRVIDHSCSEPLGDFMSSDRFLCHVNLFESRKGQWELLKHKNGLRDSDLRARLYAVLEAEYTPIFEKLSREGEIVELQQLSSDLSLMLDGLLRGKEARKPGNKQGKVDPTNTKPERLNASEIIGAGKCRGPLTGPPRNGFVISFQPLNGLIGKVDVNGRRVQVILNLKHPAIARWRQEKAKEQFLTTALALLDGHQVIVGRDNPEQLKLQIADSAGGYSSFVKLLSDWLAGVRSPAT